MRNDYWPEYFKNRLKFKSMNNDGGSRDYGYYKNENGTLKFDDRPTSDGLTRKEAPDEVEVLDYDHPNQYVTRKVLQQIGERYQIELSKNRFVWLNARSSLVRPIGRTKEIGQRIDGKEVVFEKEIEDDKVHVGQTWVVIDKTKKNELKPVVVKRQLRFGYFMMQVDGTNEEKDQLCYHKRELLTLKYCSDNQLGLAWSDNRKKELKNQKNLPTEVEDITNLKDNILNKCHIECAVEACDGDDQHLCPAKFIKITTDNRVARLHFLEWPKSYDVWVHAADATDIQPIGWCKKFGLTLFVPASVIELGFGRSENKDEKKSEKKDEKKRKTTHSDAAENDTSEREDGVEEMKKKMKTVHTSDTSRVQPIEQSQPVAEEAAIDEETAIDEESNDDEPSSSKGGVEEKKKDENKKKKKKRGGGTKVTKRKNTHFGGEKPLLVLGRDFLKKKEDRVDPLTHMEQYSIAKEEDRPAFFKALFDYLNEHLFRKLLSTVHVGLMIVSLERRGCRGITTRLIHNSSRIELLVANAAESEEHRARLISVFAHKLLHAYLHRIDCVDSEDVHQHGKNFKDFRNLINSKLVGFTIDC